MHTLVDTSCCCTTWSRSLQLVSPKNRRRHMLQKRHLPSRPRLRTALLLQARICPSELPRHDKDRGS